MKYIVNYKLKGPDDMEYPHRDVYDGGSPIEVIKRSLKLRGATHIYIVEQKEHRNNANKH